MKRIVTIVGILCVVAVIVIGIVVHSPQRTQDFRGTVTDIQTDGDVVTIRIETMSLDTAYTVKADNKTTVKPCHDNDPAVTVADITVGCTIEGDYRFGDKQLAKYIILWCE